MYRLLTLIFILFISSSCNAQVSDFISVRKKNNRTLKTYFPGSIISCQTVYGNFINGIVQDVRNDSVFVKEYDVRAIPNQWGVATVDTLGSYIVGIHYKDIDVVAFKKKQSFGFIKNGSLLMIGGLGYAMLNLINGQYLNEPITGPENLKSLGISLGAAGLGYAMNRINKINNRSGKRYKVEYIRMTGEKLKPF